MFAGKEVSRALGLMSLEADDCCGELADLTPRQLEVLDEWVAKFRGKYHVVGRVRHQFRRSGSPRHCITHVLWLKTTTSCRELRFCHLPLGVREQKHAGLGIVKVLLSSCQGCAWQRRLLLTLQ